MNVYFRSAQKGKGKATDTVSVNIVTPKKEYDEVILSDDWDESEMELAFKKSRYVNFHICLLKTIFIMTAKRRINSRDDEVAVAEGSNVKKTEDDLSDDPFADIISKNPMPRPPSKEKKVYLEDYDQFSVKQVP
jgi:hypothetical protein